MTELDWPLERPISVVGIGADGWDGLGGTARRAIVEADVLLGSGRQLALVPEGETGAGRVAWPAPLVPALTGLLKTYAGERVCVLASGDPMFFGIGVTLARLVGARALRVVPQPSSAALACARLGWALAETPVVSAVGRRLETVLPELADGRRVLVLGPDEHTPAQLAELLARNGFGASMLTVLEQLGGPGERSASGTAENWDLPAGDALNIVAVECVAQPSAVRLSRLPGLPDSVYSGDGQLTKAEVRTLTVAALAPAPGELLWDVGGGSGTIAIEWCRTHSSCRAVTFEHLDTRREQIAVNAAALGVPTIDMRGAAPDAFGGPAPDAIFIGGGLTQDDMFDACWQALRPGGRLVANTVTAESESLLLTLAAAHGGTLRRFQIYRAEPLGGFTSWRPQLPVTQWSVVKPSG
ncbi:bifunctional cobalt-precorrin-7 (C(5))-methyltransferase/cobalt-precorrin-6B (C(15))-methyltransferase [Nocardia uniformis]|uniref:Bifunctional cobalt-precorrin-7 (C(5))-methyltransferase/cobalt-precorrin-6B (C(15))-methyltransferase n=1 Tax=Nocardia uniformis TaxID=53432 RepID=A0A849BWH4_9NOCA|nr:bifunctional cobalt-precorrin-7 (C(5))-methyltransferase/cobalt-precorrin-6B (C(15))-methyltransferase [Nocardia uniformis]NNH69346.1 bifunctional cobalt-precorrin-7 (C(5))-methyltransferase/cobalt-precorrin-6B (C(15))-methyltransferase [Nocardia uniformis]